MIVLGREEGARASVMAENAAGALARQFPPRPIREDAAPEEHERLAGIAEAEAERHAASAGKARARGSDETVARFHERMAAKARVRARGHREAAGAARGA